MKHTHSMTVAENVQRKLQDIARKMAAGNVKVGFLADSPLSTYPDGTPVAAVAFWNEFGTSTSPPRPYFRTMISKEAPSWPGKMVQAYKATNGDGAKVLALMGEDISAALQESITELTSPKLAESTIARKGFDKPLVDTGQMLRAVTYEVEK